MLGRFIVALGVCMMCLVSSVSASGSSIYIGIGKSVIYNIYLKVLVNGTNDVPDGTKFELYSLESIGKSFRGKDLYSSTTEDYTKVAEGYSKDSHVLFEDVEEGLYFVRSADDNPYSGYKILNINEEFLETQHKPRILHLSFVGNSPEGGSNEDSSNGDYNTENTDKPNIGVEKPNSGNGSTDSELGSTNQIGGNVKEDILVEDGNKLEPTLEDAIVNSGIGDIVNTGDDTVLWKAYLGILCSVLGFILLVYSRRRGRDDEMDKE